MNAKPCKKLRSAARRMTVGKPASRLLARKVQAGPLKARYEAIIAVNDPSTTRGVYRNLKASVRRAEARL